MTALRDFVDVNRRYARSAHIEHDLESWLRDGSGYILTPLACMSLERILNGLRTGGQRAWSIIGPYGSGKSSFSLAMAQLLSSDSAAIQADLAAKSPSAWGLLQEVRQRHGRLVPIFVTCSRDPLVPALGRGIMATLDSAAISEVEASTIRESVEKCDGQDSTAICKSIQAIADSPGVGGVVVVVDEFGKALEYMADNRADGDVFVLQMLAEMAARSRRPIVVCTVLHQALDRYVSYLSDVQRDELAKIQGRYEEVAFHEPLDQMLRLLAQSISLKGNEAGRRAITDHYRGLARRALELGLAPSTMDPDEFVDVLTSLAPIHPLTARIMPRVFSTVAQAERSLFAFVSSEEPHGLQEFLDTPWSPGQSVPAYSLADLYNYAVSAYGSSLYESRLGHNWAASDSALIRMHDDDCPEAQVIKTIGIMSAMGPIAGRGPSLELIEFAFGDARLADETIQSLERRSLIVYRSFSESYALWDGSDIDIEERLVDAAGDIGDACALDALLNELRPPRPIVAHRHSYQKGVLRLFDSSYCLVSGLQDHIALPSSEEADGRLVYLICQDVSSIDNLRESLAGFPGIDDPLLIIMPVIATSRARSAALQLKRLQWVKDNTPALASDVVASREWRIRFAEAQNALGNEVAELAAPNPHTVVFNQGRMHGLGNKTSISSFVSDVCDREFKFCPELRNELINRRKISSQAARARRDLIEAMIVNRDKPRLGIEGYPPHLGMYLTVLCRTGLHREKLGRWDFHDVDDGSTFAPIWHAWRAFLQRASDARVGLDQFMEVIQSRPYGLSSGVSPIVLVAFLLGALEEVAIYESGVFLPYLGAPEAERLIKDPSRFDVRYFGSSEGYEALYRALARAQMVSDDNAMLLAAIRPICSVAARLVPFSRNTAKLPVDAAKVRDTVLVAREPDRLLLEQLPHALGMPIVSQWEPARAQSNAEEFASRLKAAVVALDNAYDNLLHLLHARITAEFGVDASNDEATLHLRDRFAPIADVPMPVRAKALLGRLCDSSHSRKEWVESVASFVAGKPPYLWTDQDQARFELELLLLRNQLSHVLTLASYSDDRVLSRDSSRAWAARVSITTSRGAESEDVIQLDGEKDRRAGEYADTVVSYLDATIGSGEHDMMLAVAARTVEMILARREATNGEVDRDDQSSEATCAGPVGREG